MVEFLGNTLGETMDDKNQPNEFNNEEITYHGYGFNQNSEDFKKRAKERAREARKKAYQRAKEHKKAFEKKIKEKQKKVSLSKNQHEPELTETKNTIKDLAPEELLKKLALVEFDTDGNSKALTDSSHVLKLFEQD